MNRKKTLSLLIALAMFVCALPTVAFAEEAPMEISVAVWKADETITTPEEDAVLKQICDKLNITLKPINVTWDDYEQKIQVWAASDQLPDVFAIDAFGKPFYDTWVKEELVQPLPDDLSAYPSLNNLLSGADYQAHKYSDGKLYCIPRPAYSMMKMFANEKALLIRKDWMEALGYNNAPQSFEEMKTMLDDMMKNNPEQKPGVVGATSFDYSFILWFMSSYNSLTTAGSNPWVRFDGKWRPSIFDENTKEGVVKMGELWDAGLIDRDVPAIKEDDGADKFASGRAVAYAYGGYPSALRIVEEKFKITYPDKDFSELVTIVKPWPNEEGVHYYSERVTPWSESYINAKADEAKRDKILQLFDYLLSDEGLRLLRYGIEGVDYEMDGDQFKLLLGPDEVLSKKYPFLDEGACYLASWDQDFDYESPQFSPYIHDLSNEILNWHWEGTGDSVFQDFRTDFIIPPLASTKQVILTDDIMIAMTAEDTAATWDQILEDHLNSGYDKVIEQFNEMAIEQGVLP